MERELYYEGSHEERLYNVLTKLLYILKKYDSYSFEEKTNKISNVRNDILFGVEIKPSDLEPLSDLLHFLPKTESIVKIGDFEKIKFLIEPLEIILSESSLFTEEE